MLCTALAFRAECISYVQPFAGIMAFANANNTLAAIHALVAELTELMSFTIATLAAVSNAMLRAACAPVAIIVYKLMTIMGAPIAIATVTRRVACTAYPLAHAAIKAMSATLA